MKEYGIINKNLNDFMKEYNAYIEKYANYDYEYIFQSEDVAEIHEFCADTGLDSSNSCIEIIYEDGGSDFDETEHFLLMHPISAKEIRELSGLSQDRFGQRYNIPVGTLRNWEQGKRDCPDYVLSLLERAVRADFQQK